MQIFCRKPSVSLFDRKRLHSCVPSKDDTFGGRSYGFGRPLRRSLSVSPWKERLTASGFSRVGTAACLIATIVLGSVSCSIVAAAGKSTLNGAAPAYNRWASYVAEASSRFGVPAHWIRAVMQLESTGDQGAVSQKGAMGLMQVMPETYAELRLRYHLGADPYKPRNNILAGAAYLREMHDRFGLRRLSGGLQCGTRTIRRLSEERPTASRRDAQLCRRACAHDRRVWSSTSY
jgi:Transglycosylase SLT domain